MDEQAEVIAAPVAGQALKPKIYRTDVMWGASFIGGPIAATYVLAHNYKVFGEKEKAKRTWIIGGLATVGIFYVAYILYEWGVRGYAFPIVYSVGAYGLMSWLQGKKITFYLLDGGRHYSGWRIAGIGLLIGLVTVGLFLGVAYLTDPTVTSSVKTYGVTQNEIYFNDEITPSEADRIAAALQEVGFFTDERKISVLVEGKNTVYEIKLSLIDKKYLDDPAILRDYRLVREAVQARFPANKIIVTLSAPDGLDEIQKTLR